jgi:hypothetical protein
MLSWFTGSKMADSRDEDEEGRTYLFLEHIRGC